MKHQELIFKRPVRVLQLYCNINIYNKTDKSFDDRKEALKWKDISSKSGYVLNNELFLPENIVDIPGHKHCRLLTMEDQQQAIAVQSPQKPVYNRCFQLLHPEKMHIFEISNVNGLLELRLIYNYFTIGTPERTEFKLCELNPGIPVEIKINGKTDFSLTGRRARVFKEQSYIIEYLGDFAKCTLLKEAVSPVIKSIPAHRKIIDLIKPLW